MASVIISCGCGNSSTYCRNAYKVLHPNSPIPQLYVKGKARSLLESLPNPSEAYTQLSNLMTKRGRFGYLLEWDEDGKVTEFYDLLKSRRMP